MAGVKKVYFVRHGESQKYVNLSIDEELERQFNEE